MVEVVDAIFKPITTTGTIRAGFRKVIGKFVSIAGKLNENFINMLFLVTSNHDRCFDVSIEELKSPTKCKVNKTVLSWNENFDTAIQSFPTIIATTVSLTKFVNAIAKRDKMKKLLAHIKNNYENLMKVPEREIMRKFTMASRKITIYYATFITIFASLFSLMPFTPMLIDSLMSLNETRKKKFLYEADYMVDDQKYYVPIILHQFVISSLVIYILIAVDAMFMVYAQHACALFAVVSCCIKYIHIVERKFLSMDEIQSLSETYKKHEYTETEITEILRKLKWIIRMHNNAVAYCRLLESSFTMSVGIQVTLNIVCISVTGVQFVIHMDNLDDAIKYGSFLAGQLNHLFFLCLPGQRILNHCDKLCIDIYAAAWYALPRKVQTLYKLILLRSLVPCKLTAGKIVTLCMETFLGVTQTAVSYFTVLSSMR